MSFLYGSTVWVAISEKGLGEIESPADTELAGNPYVDSTNNGLVHVVNRFKNEKIAGHMTMNKGERSVLAELATNLL